MEQVSEIEIFPDRNLRVNMGEREFSIISFVAERLRTSLVKMSTNAWNKGDAAYKEPGQEWCCIRESQRGFSTLYYALVGVQQLCPASPLYSRKWIWFYNLSLKTLNYQNDHSVLNYRDIAAAMGHWRGDP